MADSAVMYQPTSTTHLVNIMDMDIPMDAPVGGDLCCVAEVLETACGLGACGLGDGYPGNAAHAAQDLIDVHPERMTIFDFEVGDVQPVQEPQSCDAKGSRMKEITDADLNGSIHEDEMDEAGDGSDGEHSHVLVEKSRLGLEKLTLLAGAPRGPRNWPGSGTSHRRRFFLAPHGFQSRLGAKLYRSCRDLDQPPRFSSVPEYPASQPQEGLLASMYNRKRRYEDDDYERRPQRRRFEESASTRVRKQILAIAESPLRNAQEEVAAVAAAIADNYDDEYFRNHVAELVLQLVVEQPLKIPFAAGIVLHANALKPEFVALVLEKVAPRVQTNLDAGEWRGFKLLLRFLACLQGLFEGEGLFGVLDELFNRAVDLQTASSDDAIGLELVKIIMLTLPYLLASSATGLEQKTAELLEKTDIVASAPHPLEGLVDPYVSPDSQGIAVAQSLIGLLQKQLRAEAAKNWELAFIPRLFADPSQDLTMQDKFPGEGNGGKHAFPALTVPQVITAGTEPILPEVYFSLYADQDVETVPPTSSLAASVIRDALVDTIDMLDFNRNVAAKFLIDVDCYFTPDTFVKRATPFDKVKEVAGAAKSTWKPEDLAVDAIFSQIFKLPAPPHKLVYYHTMIVETCKIAPAAIAPSLGRAIRFLYRNLDVMDAELSYRFMDWFAHHLSNFDFRWKWIEWVDDVDRTRLDARKAFILGALDKEVRLSFAKRIRETLPDVYHPLIPASKDNDIPEFKYNDAGTPYASEAKQILALLKKKSPESDIQPVIDAIHDAEAAAGSPDPLLASTDAYVTAICYIGSKSLSHVLSYIERCKDRLLSLAASPPAQRQLVSSVVDYWRLVQPGVAVNIVDKLLNYTVLSPVAVVEWALADRLDGGRALADAWLYEIVARTVAKVTGRVRQILAARLKTDLAPQQVAVLDETLAREVVGMRSLFGIIDAALEAVAVGIDGHADVDGDGEEAELLLMWGGKWRRVFQRKAAVEESVLAEAEKGFPPAVEALEGVGDGGAVVNGTGNPNGNGVAEELVDVEEIA